MTVRSEIRSGEDLYEDGVLVGEDVETRLPQSPLQSRRGGELLSLTMAMSKLLLVVVQVQKSATKMVSALLGHLYHEAPSCQLAVTLQSARWQTMLQEPVRDLP